MKLKKKISLENQLWRRWSSGQQTTQAIINHNLRDSTTSPSTMAMDEPNFDLGFEENHEQFSSEGNDLISQILIEEHDNEYMEDEIIEMKKSGDEFEEEKEEEKELNETDDQNHENTKRFKNVDEEHDNDNMEDEIIEIKKSGDEFEEEEEEKELNETDDENHKNTKRFKNVDARMRDDLLSEADSQNTKRSTKTHVKIFKGKIDRF